MSGNTLTKRPSIKPIELDLRPPALAPVRPVYCYNCQETPTLKPFGVLGWVFLHNGSALCAECKKLSEQTPDNDR